VRRIQLYLDEHL
jgi:metal-responsive CopG/Arc/MetJ family transcriptional regulator